jgi:hypothetical protein
MDVPVALGVGAAFVASCWATLNQSGEVYFDSVTMFVFFLLGGRYLEMTARQKALGVTEALARLLPAFSQKCQIFRLTVALSNASLLICIRVILCWFGRGDRARRWPCHRGRQLRQ